MTILARSHALLDLWAINDGQTMLCNVMLQVVRTQIDAAESRASDYARTVKARLQAGNDAADAELSLFNELDGLALLRAKQQALYLIGQGSSGSMTA